MTDRSSLKTSFAAAAACLMPLAAYAQADAPVVELPAEQVVVDGSGETLAEIQALLAAARASWDSLPSIEVGADALPAGNETRLAIRPGATVPGHEDHVWAAARFTVPEGYDRPVLAIVMGAPAGVTQWYVSPRDESIGSPDLVSFHDRALPIASASGEGQAQLPLKMQLVYGDRRGPDGAEQNLQAGAEYLLWVMYDTSYAEEIPESIRWVQVSLGCVDEDDLIWDLVRGQ